jgi:hypothetical protein
VASSPAEKTVGHPPAFKHFKSGGKFVHFFPGGKMPPSTSGRDA